MGDLLEKFDMLDTAGQQQLLDYLDFLLAKSRTKKKKRFDLKTYRENLLKVSIWSEKDLVIFDEIRAHADQWKIKEW